MSATVRPALPVRETVLLTPSQATWIPKNRARYTKGT